MSNRAEGNRRLRDLGEFLFLLSELEEELDATLEREARERPARLLYAEEHDGETEVRFVDLPGVTIQAPRRFVQALPTGSVVELVDEPEREWAEQGEDGVEVPLGTRHLLDWAREQSGRILRSGAALEIVSAVGIAAPVFLWAALGNEQMAMAQARAGSVVLGVTGVANLIRAGRS